ncbi:MAG: hypothetical protein QME74_07365, partial [Candidatus Edwardsbacteria bacterium]|nr:hypothetical protein [Candidatus Edwardsbacteria bacterium]
LDRKEAEIKELKIALEDAQLAARATPFSKEFLDLRKSFDHKEEQIAALNKKFRDSASKFETGKKELAQAQEAMAEAQAERDRLQEQGRSLEGELKIKTEELANVQAELEDSKRKADLSAVRTAEALTRINSLAEKITRIQEEAAGKLQEKENEHWQSLDSLNQKHETDLMALESLRRTELEEALSKQNAEISRREELYKKELLSIQQGLAQEKAAALAEAQGKHEQQINALNQMHASACAEQEQKYAALEKESVQMAYEIEIRNRDELKDLRSALALAEETRRKELQRLERKSEIEKRQALDAAEQEHQRLWYEQAQLNKAALDEVWGKQNADMIRKEEEFKKYCQALEHNFMEQKEQMLKAAEHKYHRLWVEQKQAHDTELLEYVRTIAALQTELNKMKT